MKKISNHIGVWMDHQHARFIYPKNKNEYMIETMISPHDVHPREDGQHSDHVSLGNYRESNNEYSRNNKEKEQLHDYYQTLQKVLVKYDEILLFGPTTAKDELFNLLFADKSFSGKRISLEKADKMSDHQLIAFVRDFFSETVKS